MTNARCLKVWLIKISRSTQLLAAALILCCGPLFAQLTRTAVTTWPTTTYYIGHPSFDPAVDGQIRITAGGSYALYLNGDLVGADDDPVTVETYEVSFKRRENQVAVVVEHDGTPSPYGLFCVLEGGEEDEEQQFVSSPTDRSVSWFWTGFPLANEEDADWTTMRFRDVSEYEEDGQAVGWQSVQAGTLSLLDVAEFEDLDLTRTNSIAGFAGGLAANRGGLQLRELSGQNVAFNSRSTEPNMVDGDLSTAVTFRRGAGALLQSVATDLGDLFAIERVRVLTQPPSRNATFEDFSLRGYSVLVSKDGVGFREVGSRNQITTYQETEVVFPPTPARHVRLTITEFSSRNASPRVGEVEVFVRGLDSQGNYLSAPLDLGSDEAKNFERVQWFGEVPDNAELYLRFRSGSDGEIWSAWSPWTSDADIALRVPEPRRLLQFEARMLSRELDSGPRLDSLAVFFDSGALPATQAAASIAPLQASIGVDTLFTYSLQLDVGVDDAGVGRLVILTPWPATVDVDAVQGLGTAAISGARAINDSLVLEFDPPITSETGTAELVVPFTTRLLSASHDFQGLLFPPGAVSSLRVEEREGEDPDSGVPYTIRTAASSFVIRVLDDVQAHPRVFTPNGDQINDFTVFGFTLGRVSDATLRFEIYDLSGRLVRTLTASNIDAGSYTPVGGSGASLPGRWDGLNDSGELLPPGLYLFRVVVDLEPDNEVSSGVVGLAY